MLPGDLQGCFVSLAAPELGQRLWRLEGGSGVKPLLPPTVRNAVRVELMDTARFAERFPSLTHEHKCKERRKTRIKPALCWAVL